MNSDNNMCISEKPDDVSESANENLHGNPPSPEKHNGTFGCAVTFFVCCAVVVVWGGKQVHDINMMLKWKRPLGDIIGIELAMTKMASDADAPNLGTLFDSHAVANYLADGVLQKKPEKNEIAFQLTTEQFQRAQKMYTASFYALLKEGRLVLKDDRVNPELGVCLHELLNKKAVGKLASSYLEEIGPDPGGNLYQMWPGPWPKESVNAAYGGPIVFRCYLSVECSLPGGLLQKPFPPDVLTINNGVENVQAPDTGEYETYGYPAPSNKCIYIWSYGKDGISGQAIYSDKGYTWKSYDPELEASHWGGGDDINSWDNNQTWMRFTN